MHAQVFRVSRGQKAVVVCSWPDSGGAGRGMVGRGGDTEDSSEALWSELERLQGGRQRSFPGLP